MKSEYLKDAAKLVDLQSEVERLQGENENLKAELNNWRETAYAERDLNKILSDRIASLLERIKL